MDLIYNAHSFGFGMINVGTLGLLFLAAAMVGDMRRRRKAAR